jgi:hypothetical protein
VVSRIISFLPRGALAVTPGRVCRAWAAMKAEAMAALKPADAHDKLVVYFPEYYVREAYARVRHATADGGDLPAMLDYRTKRTLKVAAFRHGFIGFVVEHADDPGFVDAYAGCVAAAEGHLHILKFLAWHGGCPVDSRMCIPAAAGGRVDVLSWLERMGLEFDAETVRAAAMGGQRETIAWLRFERGVRWNEGACSAAAAGGHLSTLQLLREHGCPWDEDTCSSAVVSGKIEVLRFARENGAPWDARTCEAAASLGDLETLRYCRQNGCPWDEATCVAAADRGHLDIIKFCVSNGAPLCMNVCKAAARWGHLSVLQHCVEHGCPINVQECIQATIKDYVTDELMECHGYLRRLLDEMNNDE